MTERTIWIDADGAPGVCKEMVFKASHRHKTPVQVVANRYQQTPKFRWITFQLVEGGLDVADDYIADHCRAGDLVVTSDIPLAARVVERGATVVRFSGVKCSTTPTWLSAFRFETSWMTSGVQA